MEQEMDYKFILSDKDKGILEVLMAVALIENCAQKGEISEAVLDAVKKDAKNLLKIKYDCSIL